MSVFISKARLVDDKTGEVVIEQGEILTEEQEKMLYVLGVQPSSFCISLNSPPKHGVISYHGMQLVSSMREGQIYLVSISEVSR